MRDGDSPRRVRCRMRRYRACVNCGGPVLAPKPGTVSRPHRGHVDPLADSLCGIWGWEWRSEADDDDETDRLIEAHQDDREDWSSRLYRGSR
jgi:hypothetical protein